MAAICLTGVSVSERRFVYLTGIVVFPPTFLERLAFPPKRLNDDTITRSDLAMRGFQLQVPPALSSPSNPDFARPARMMIDLFVTDCRKQPLIFQYFNLKIIYNCNHGAVSMGCRLLKGRG